MIGIADNMFNAPVTVATKAAVQAWRESGELKERYMKIAAGDAGQKRFCPILLPNGVSTTGKRLNEDMRPTGNLFIDYDEKGNGWKILWEKVKDHLDEWNILLVEKSARGGAHMVVKRKRGLSIEEDIDAWEDRLDLRLDHVHDLARCMYIVPDDYVLYEDDELYAENTGNIETTEKTGNTGNSKTQELNNPQPNTASFTIKMEMFERKDVRLMDVALKWLEHLGYSDPERGEDGNRNNVYLEMARGCKKLADSDDEILFHNLPSLGMTEEKRRGIIKSLTKRETSMIPHEFFCWLREEGFLKGSMRQQDNETTRTGFVLPTDEQKRKTVAMIKADKSPSVPQFIPFPFRPYMESAPENMKEVVMFCLVPLFYTLRPRIRSFYGLNSQTFGRKTEKQDYCLSQTIVVGESGSGKSIMLDLKDDLMERLSALDEQAWKNAEEYQKALKANKYNTKKQPDADEYKVNLRIIPAKTSVPALLEMQRDAGGLSQLMVCEELDTLSGSASGKTGTSMNINPLLRVAFTGGAYSQKYKNNDTFQGEVHLFLNVLATGTFNQLDTMFPDVMNGLVNRYNLCLMPEDWTGVPPEFKPFSDNDKMRLDEFVDDCFRHTYADDDGLTVIPWYDVDTRWAVPMFQGWVKQKIQGSEVIQDHATKTFCKRIGQMMNRLFAFIKDCYKSDDEFENDKMGILKFCFYYGECSLHNMLRLYGLEYNRKMWELLERQATGVKPRGNTILDNLPYIFDKADVEEAQKVVGSERETAKTISELKARGHIIELTPGGKVFRKLV